MPLGLDPKHKAENETVLSDLQTAFNPRTLQESL